MRLTLNRLPLSRIERRRRASARRRCQCYLPGAASAGMMLLSIQIGLFTSDLNIAPLGAQLYCATGFAVQLVNRERETDIAD